MSLLRECEGWNWPPTSDWSLFGGQLDILCPALLADPDCRADQCDVELDCSGSDGCGSSSCCSVALQQLDDDDWSSVSSSSTATADGYSCRSADQLQHNKLSDEDCDLLLQCTKASTHLTVVNGFDLSTPSTATMILEDLDYQIGGYVTSLAVEPNPTTTAANTPLVSVPAAADLYMINDVDVEDVEIVDVIEVIECIEEKANGSDKTSDLAMTVTDSVSSKVELEDVDCCEAEDSLVKEVGGYCLTVRNERLFAESSTICTDDLNSLLAGWPPDLCSVDDSNSSDFHVDETVVSSLSTAPSLSFFGELCCPQDVPPGCLRRLRKKEQNKSAASRYRQKKRSEQGLVQSEYSLLEQRNTELKKKLQEMMHEIRYLKGLIDELCP